MICVSAKRGGGVYACLRYVSNVLFVSNVNAFSVSNPVSFSYSFLLHVLYLKPSLSPLLVFPLNPKPVL